VRRLPILTFHALDEGSPPLSFPPDVFVRGMRGLHRDGWRALPLGEAVRLLFTGALPGRTLALTFDDGYRSVHDRALPVLEELGWPATVFLAPGGAPPAPGRRLPPMEGREMLSWEEAGLLLRRGWEVGAHTLHHADLCRLAPAQAEEEILRSREVLEQALSVPVRLFAYPFGRWSRAAAAAVRRGFDAACTDRLGLADPGDDRHLLPRLEAHYFRTPGLLGILGSPLLGPYLSARGLPRALRRLLTG
jgi:peptidoglycan/xylan/chitin deacetylase (PgdA/CDA1 family)